MGEIPKFKPIDQLALAAIFFPAVFGLLVIIIGVTIVAGIIIAVIVGGGQ